MPELPKMPKRPDGVSLPDPQKVKADLPKPSPRNDNNETVKLPKPNITHIVVEETEAHFSDETTDTVIVEESISVETSNSDAPLPAFLQPSFNGKVKLPPKINKNVPDNIEVEEWTDDTTTDPVVGLGSETENTNKTVTRRGKGFAITERDIVIMRFLTRYRYAYVDQIARLVNAEIKDVKARLKRLENQGFIRSEDITAGQGIFLIKKAGLSVIDMDFPEIKKGSVSYITVAHTVGLVNLAVELEMATGGKNILGEEVFPVFNRYPLGIFNPDEEPSLIGETTVTEREIRRGNKLFRGDKTTEDMRILAREAADDPSAPERLEGNEGLFVVYGSGKDGEHVPDLVISRPRDEDGKVQHIAIELELTPKSNSEWSRILRWYRDHGFMYKKVIYFTHKRSLAENLKKVIADLGMEEFVFVRKYIPQNNRGPFWG